jgi:hypothetical protein
MNRRFGVITEDQTDGDVVRVVIRRLAGDQTPVKVRSQKGCSKIKAKAARIIVDLVATNDVSDIIVVQDLDRNPTTKQLNDEGQLRQLLSDSCQVRSAAIRRLICIPVEELEAWFWSDEEVVKTVGRGKGDAHPEPHRIMSPKEKLQRLSYGENAKPRYTTQDNPDLARKLNLAICAKRCPSFKSLVDFVAPSALASP